MLHKPASSCFIVIVVVNRSEMPTQFKAEKSSIAPKPIIRFWLKIDGYVSFGDEAALQSPRKLIAAYRPSRIPFPFVWQAN